MNALCDIPACKYNKIKVPDDFKSIWDFNEVGEKCEILRHHYANSRGVVMHVCENCRSSENGLSFYNGVEITPCRKCNILPMRNQYEAGSHYHTSMATIFCPECGIGVTQNSIPDRELDKGGDTWDAHHAQYKRAMRVCTFMWNKINKNKRD